MLVPPVSMDCQSFFRSFESGMVEEPETGIRVSSLSLENHRVRRMVFDPGVLIPNHRHLEGVVTLVL